MKGKKVTDPLKEEALRKSDAEPGVKVDSEEGKQNAAERSQVNPCVSGSNAGPGKKVDAEEAKQNMGKRYQVDLNVSRSDEAPERESDSEGAG